MPPTRSRCSSNALHSLPLLTFDLHIAGRTWTIRAVRDQDALLGASDQFEQFPYGLLLWESAPALAEAMGEHPEWVTGKHVLELGAGVGLAGLVARHLGASVRQTDHMPEALELCRMNAEANGIAGIDLALADWNDWQDETPYDLIIGADILYDHSAHAPVLSILENNLAPGGRVLLTDPGRTDTPAFMEQQKASSSSAQWRIVQVPMPSVPGGASRVTLIMALRP